MYHCNIKLPYRIRKVVENISINIVGQGEKVMRWRWTFRNYTRWIEM